MKGGMKMKVFLFLYPLAAYVDSCAERSSLFRDGKYSPKYLDLLIRRRYREKGYKIAWMLFSRHDGSRIPDRNGVSDVFSIGREDEVIACGISAAAMFEEKKYPQWQDVLANLGPTETLILGGFHILDCVCRMARTAHEHGREVLVDEDLTDLFFAQTHLRGYPPLDGFSFSGQEAIRNAGLLLDAQITIRQGQPWLLQVNCAMHNPA